MLLQLVVTTNFCMKRDLVNIDLFKVYAAILQGVQNYWGERAAKRKMKMVDCDR